MFARKRNKYIFAKPKKSEIIMKGVLVVLLVAAIAVVGMFIYFNLFGTASKVHLVEKVEAEINSEVDASSFIERIDDGGVIYSESKIDTSKLGKTECEVMLKFGDKMREYNFDVTIVDTTAPVIQCDESFNILKDSKVDLVKLTSASDNSGEKIKVSADGKIDSSKKGTYDVTLSSKDSSGNETKKKVSVTVIEPKDLKNGDKFYTEKGFVAERKDGVLMIGGQPIINKSFEADSSYAPGVNEEGYKAFNEMLDAADKAGRFIEILSTYRSYGAQNSKYYSKVRELGEEKALTAEPKAGFSEHQSGYAYDVNKTSTDFADSEDGKWILSNCYKYGFIVRYPSGKESVTGYDYSPWHLRYVGKELAEKLYNNGDWITLEEYYGIPSVYAEGAGEE